MISIFISAASFQQILGASWVLRAQLIADSDWLTAGSEGDVENEERTAKINAHLQSLFGAQFQILFGKIHEIVSYFVIFCNLINILYVGTGSCDPRMPTVYVCMSTPHAGFGQKEPS